LSKRYASIALSVAVLYINPLFAQRAPESKKTDDSDQSRALKLLEPVKELLSDPFSAKFRKLGFSEKGYLCGEVNAKNKAGGYAGWKVFWNNGGPVRAESGKETGNIGIGGSGGYDESFPVRAGKCENLKPVKVKMEGIVD
jgi:hypothetical protein